MKVKCAFPQSTMAYTYEWPDKFDPLQVGDIVEVPQSWAFPEGGRTAVVVGIGSDYDGPLQQLVRRVI